MISSSEFEEQVEATTKTYLQRVIEAALAEYAAGRITQPVLTLGVLYEWYQDIVAAPVVEQITEAWNAAFPEPTPANATARATHLAAVTDRLSRRIDPALPEGAMDQVRLSQSAAALEGWTPEEMARDIAERLAWEPDKTYWKEQKARAEAAIDDILDPFGPPGTPARTYAHQNDPDVKALQAIRAEAVDRINADESIWGTRARRIARTEFTSMQNAGALAALIDEGRTHKKWLATHDGRTRPEHLEAHGQVVPITQPFRVGAFLLQIPGDPTAPPHLTVNCRCTIIGADAPANVLTAGSSMHWKTQLRIPKGNGKRSGYSLEHSR